MSSTMLVHDRRLGGSSPSGVAANTYEVDGSVAIGHAIGWIGTYARRSGGLSNLSIMCHGYESEMNERDQMCMSEMAGGFGLQLCREGLDLGNVSLTTSWRGQIRRIILFACSPAQTAPWNVGGSGDGRRFCGELALWTQAQVIAAEQTQYYVTRRSFWQWLTGQNAAGTIDFGSWEGPVYLFSPADPYGRRIHV